MLHRVVWRILIDVPEANAASIIRVIALMMAAIGTCVTSGNIYHITQNIPEYSYF
jgi:hypothetical protein